MDSDHVRYTHLVILNREDRDALGLFNPGAYPQFPEGIRETAISCSERLSLVVYHVRAIGPQIDNDVGYFTSEVNRQLRTVTIPDDMLLIVCYRSPAYLASLHGVLYSLKSFLDLMANLWVRLISERAKIRGFDEKDGLAGGKLIRWLRSTAPPTFQNRIQLASIIEENSQEWITEAVSYRNTLVHKGEIDGLRHLVVMARKGQWPYSREDVCIPKMPDGKPVGDYCKVLLKNTIDFVKDGLALVPNIDIQKISSVESLFLTNLYT